MTEIGLLFATNLLGLVFVAALVRWLMSRERGSPELKRLGGAARRAVDALLWGEYRGIALLVGALALANFAAQSKLAPASERMGAVEAAFWSSTFMVLGAVGAAATAWAGAHFARAGALRALPAAQRSLDAALSVVARASGASAVLVETWSVLGCGLPCVLLLAMKGGFDAPGAGVLAGRIVAMLPSYAAGAAAAALVIQRAGSLYKVAGDLGADVGGEHRAHLDHDDAQNPALVADLAGDHAGVAASRSVDFFLSATIGNVATTFVVLSLVQRGVSLPLALMPLVVRGFGVVASAFGVSVVRTAEHEPPLRALWRGHAATSVIALGGVAGAGVWLADRQWPWFFAAGAAGVLAVTAIAFRASWRAQRRLVRGRDTSELERAGSAILVGRGLASGLLAPVGPVVLLGAALLGSWQFGKMSGLAGGEQVALLTACAAMLTVGPYLLAAGLLGSAVDSARAMAALGVTPGDDWRRRTERLDDAGFAAAAASQSYLIVLGGLVAWIMGETALAAPFEGLHPALGWCAALGAGLVLAYASSATDASSRLGREMVAEVGRQLTPAGPAAPPLEGYVPSYRACIEIGTRGALRGLWLPVAAGLFAPVLLGSALALMYRSTAPGLAAAGLTSFVAAATITGLVAALAAERARVLFASVRRMHRARTAEEHEATITGDAIGDVLGHAAGPSAQLIVRAVAVVSLALLPLLH